MPFLLAEILNFQGSTPLIGVGSFSKLIIEKDWHNWSNIRDAYTYLQFYSVDVVWYKNYLLRLPIPKMGFAP